MGGRLKVIKCQWHSYPNSLRPSLTKTCVKMSSCNFRWQGVIEANVKASLCYRNRAEITVLMCEQEPCPVWFSCRRKSYPVWLEHWVCRREPSLFKGPCSPKRLCALVFLFWNDSFVKCSVLIGFHFEERCVTILKNDCEGEYNNYCSFFHAWPKLRETVSKRPVRLLIHVTSHMKLDCVT